MSVVAKCYGKGFLAAFNKEVDWNSDSIKTALTTSTYVPDQDVEDYFNDITNEVSATGYTAGGVAIGSCTATYTGATNKIMLDGADVTWTITGTLTFRNAIVYDSTPGTAATNPLLGYQASSADVSVTDGVLTITWSASGIIEITVA